MNGERCGAGNEGTVGGPAGTRSASRQSTARHGYHLRVWGHSHLHRGSGRVRLGPPLDGHLRVSAAASTSGNGVSVTPPPRRAHLGVRGESAILTASGVLVGHGQHGPPTGDMPDSVHLRPAASSATPPQRRATFGVHGESSSSAARCYGYCTAQHGPHSAACPAGQRPPQLRRLGLRPPPARGTGMRSYDQAGLHIGYAGYSREGSTSRERRDRDTDPNAMLDVREARSSRGWEHYDFRVEGGTREHLIVRHASTDRVGSGHRPTMRRSMPGTASFTRMARQDSRGRRHPENLLFVTLHQRVDRDRDPGSSSGRRR